MKVEVEVPYPVSGLLPQHRTAARGVATFRKSFDLAEATDQDLPVAFSVSGLRSTLSRSRNREGHDVLSTVVCDGSPWMAIDFDGSAPIREPSLAGMLGNVVSRRIARFVELDQDLAPIDAARFRSVVHDGREECERIAREAVARLMLWRGKVWERNVVPLYAVHGGDRPDVSIVPSSSARYNFFDHFLPNDRDTALEKFASYGGRGSVAHIEAAAEFSFDLEMYRPLLVRAARDLVESLEDGINRENIGRWRLRLGGEKLLRAAELIETRADDETLELTALTSAMHVALSVAQDLRPAPDDQLMASTEMAGHRLNELLRLVAARHSQPGLPGPR